MEQPCLQVLVPLRLWPVKANVVQVNVAVANVAHLPQQSVVVKKKLQVNVVQVNAEQARKKLQANVVQVSVEATRKKLLANVAQVSVVDSTLITLAQLLDALSRVNSIQRAQYTINLTCKYLKGYNNAMPIK